MEETLNTPPRILVIEDDLCYQRLLERYIQRCGGLVRSASDGKSGLKKAMAGHFDLAFVDIQLPKTDGFMVATLLREQGYSLPLIGMSSLQLEGMDVKAQTIGFDEFLHKPISEKAVARLLTHYTRFDVTKKDTVLVD